MTMKIVHTLENAHPSFTTPHVSTTVIESSPLGFNMPGIQSVEFALPEYRPDSGSDIIMLSNVEDPSLTDNVAYFAAHIQDSKHTPQYSGQPHKKRLVIFQCAYEKAPNQYTYETSYQLCNTDMQIPSSAFLVSSRKRSNLHALENPIKNNKLYPLLIEYDCIYQEQKFGPNKTHFFITVGTQEIENLISEFKFLSPINLQIQTEEEKEDPNAKMVFHPAPMDTGNEGIDADFAPVSSDLQALFPFESNF